MAGGKNKIHEHPNAGKGNFAANPQNIYKKGGNRKLIGMVNKQLEEVGIEETTAAEIKSIYLRLIQCTKEEITQTANDDDSPMLLRIVAGAMIEGKGIEIIERILDRSIGKAIQHTILENTDIKPVKYIDATKQ